MEDNSQFSDVYRILTFFVITVMSIALAVLFYQVHWLFYVFAVLAFLCVLTVMLDFTIRRVTRLTYRDIGQFSTVGQTTLGHTRVFKPLGIAAPHERAPQPTMPAIPTIAEMLAKSLLDGIQLMLWLAARTSTAR